jgi:hypothetical protein
MAISLYDISVRAYLQTLPMVSAYLEKGRAHFESEWWQTETI